MAEWEVIALDFRSDSHAFHSHHRRSYFSVADIFLNYNIHDKIPSKYVINRVIDFIYIFYNRKSCTNLR